MSGSRPIKPAWLRLFLALIAVMGMLLHAVTPVAAIAGTPDQATLRLLGATLCVTHGGTTPDRQPDGPPAACDHCPLCGVAVSVPLAILAEADALPLPSAHAGHGPALPRSHAPPRAPPRLAHSPRAPPVAL